MKKAPGIVYVVFDGGGHPAAFKKKADARAFVKDADKDPDVVGDGKIYTFFIAG